MTEVRPISAPILTRMASQGTPMTSMPTAIGSGTFSCGYGTSPVRTAATAM